MQKKFLFGLLLFSIVILLSSTFTFATDEVKDSMEKSCKFC